MSCGFKQKKKREKQYTETETKTKRDTEKETVKETAPHNRGADRRRQRTAPQPKQTLNPKP